MSTPPPEPFLPGTADREYAAPPMRSPAVPVPQLPTPNVTNGSAIAAFVLSLAAFIFTPIVSIAAAVLGHHARAVIRRTGERGAGLATAALFISYAWMAIGVSGIVFLVALFSNAVAI